MTLRSWFGSCSRPSPPAACRRRPARFVPRLEALEGRLAPAVALVSAQAGPGALLPGNAASAPGRFSVSADGRFVAFASDASDLVAGDTNGFQDIFVRDLKTGTTVRASTDAAGAQGNGVSEVPALSADGRYVAFSSYASNLVAGDSNGVPDLFARDLTVALPPPPPSCGADVATIIGTPGEDTLVGTPGRDVVLAGSGNDTIRTGGGDDVICAGNGDDSIDAGTGDDVVQGGFGADHIVGADGNDQLFGRWGTDTLAGGAGDDLLKGGKGDDSVDGGDGFDTCRGGSGSDTAGACERVRGVP